MKTLTIGFLLFLSGITGTLYIQQVEKHAYQRGRNACHAEAREEYAEAADRAKREGIEQGRVQAKAEYEQQCREEKAALEADAYTRGKDEGVEVARLEADSIIAAILRRHQQELDERQARWSQALADSVNHARNRLHDIYRRRGAGPREAITSQGPSHSGLNFLLKFSHWPIWGILTQVFVVLAIAFITSGFGAFVMSMARKRPWQ